MGTAKLKLATGKKAGQFRFVLYGKNGECIGSSNPETYTTKQSAKKVLAKYFSNFEIIDETKAK